MNKRVTFGAFIFPVMMMVLIITFYSRLGGTENVKYIHIVTLIALGMTIGILVRNIIAYFFGRL